MGWYFIEGYYKDWVGYMWGLDIDMRVLMRLKNIMERGRI